MARWDPPHATKSQDVYAFQVSSVLSSFKDLNFCFQRYFHYFFSLLSEAIVRPLPFYPWI